MADIVALGVLLPPATYFLTTGQSSGPDFVIPTVIVWSYVSIAVELNNPSDTLVELYGHPAILAVQNASYVFAGLIGIMLVPRIIIWIAISFCTIDVVELIEEEEDNISAAMNEVRRGGGGFHGTNSNGGANNGSTSGLFQRFSLRRDDDGATSLDPSVDENNSETGIDVITEGDDEGNTNHEEEIE